MSPQLCTCDGPPHPYDPSWCVGGRKGPSREQPVSRAPVAGELRMTAGRSAAPSTTSPIDITVLIDGQTYSLQVAGDTTDALFATNVGRAITVAILEHGARTGGRA